MLENLYTEFYITREARTIFPNEAIVRIFRGTYPQLDLPSSSYTGKKLADIGCGDGMNFLALADLKMTLMGTEISKEICSSTTHKLAKLGIKINLRVGKSHHLPFLDDEIDYLLSWNSSYYMGLPDTYLNYNSHIAEFHRTIKKDGQLIMSVPMVSNSIFNNSKIIEKGYRTICNDPYKIRNGTVMRAFDETDDLQKELDPYFSDFRFATIRNDFFGQNNHHIIVVAKKI